MDPEVVHTTIVSRRPAWESSILVGSSSQCVAWTTYPGRDKGSYSADAVKLMSHPEVIHTHRQSSFCVGVASFSMLELPKDGMDSTSGPR